MIANLITLFRLILVFVVISLFGHHVYLDILLVGLIGLILFLDAVDGYVARKLNQTSDFGALFDIIGDRIVECIFWVYFSVVGLIPFWIPVIVIARGFFTDGLRSAAFAQGKTAFRYLSRISCWTGISRCDPLCCDCRYVFNPRASRFGRWLEVCQGLTAAHHRTDLLKTK